MVTRIPRRAALLNSVRPTALRSSEYSSSNILKLQAFQLSQIQHARHYSTPSPEASKPSDLRSQFASAPISPPTQPTSKRSLRPYIFATLCFLIGGTVGQYMSLIVSPPPLPLPNTNEDKLMVEFLEKEAAKIPLVKSLSEDPAWKQDDPYARVEPQNREHQLTTGPLAGARSLGGFQRVFTNADSGETISVVWFGGAIAGWPGVTHGGVLATVMDETLGRCGIKQFPANSGGVTANLELNYLKPSITNSFYVIRAVPEREGATDKKQWVSGRLETLDGKVCVEARGLILVPKKALPGQNQKG